MITRDSRKAMAEGEGGRGGAIVGVRLREDVADMDPDGVLREEEGFGDVAIRAPICHQSEDFDLTSRETGGVGGRNALGGCQPCRERVGTGEGRLGIEGGADSADFVEQ